MKQIFEKIEGPYLVEEETRLNGLIVGDVIVESGQTFVVNGLITGNVTAKAASVVIVHGMVKGTIINSSAERVEIHGVVDHLVDEDPHSTTRVLPGAIVRNRAP